MPRLGDVEIASTRGLAQILKDVWRRGEKAIFAHVWAGQGMLFGLINHTIVMSEYAIGYPIGYSDDEHSSWQSCSWPLGIPCKLKSKTRRPVFLPESPQVTCSLSENWHSWKPSAINVRGSYRHSLSNCRLALLFGLAAA